MTTTWKRNDSKHSAVRFANREYSKRMEQRNIDHIQISLLEQVSVEERGVTTIQVVLYVIWFKTIPANPALVAMEPPVSHLEMFVKQD